MSLHLLKMCVGINNVEQLRRAQARRLALMATAGEEPRLAHMTRHTPRRAAEILAGGSIYWVIRGFARVRQRILAIERLERGQDGKRCALILDPALARTVPQPRRAHQGWRYLGAADAPRDLDEQERNAEGLPPELADELRELGLL